MRTVFCVHFYYADRLGMDFVCDSLDTAQRHCRKRAEADGVGLLEWVDDSDGEGHLLRSCYANERKESVDIVIAEHEVLDRCDPW